MLDILSIFYVFENIVMQLKSKEIIGTRVIYSTRLIYGTTNCCISHSTYNKFICWIE